MQSRTIKRDDREIRYLYETRKKALLDERSVIVAAEQQGMQ
ncbi:hypothetical protein [Numidum massiliense]|nr:hypothetical protein [Numidum massiliense]